ncbi:hypothetical protein [uncultured Bartonella sp.]|uniref:hypothetical protein n=1 Tax=uncultured Bartonella sp. TaxID=104108 RepID=UPI0025DE44C5|nr:hypothetical protein [uncultured Bartonella sp.]
MKPARINVTDDAESFKGLSRNQLAEIMADKDGLYTEDPQDTAEPLSSSWKWMSSKGSTR